MVFALIVTAVFLLYAAILAVATRRPGYQARVLRTMPTAFGLALPAWLAPVIAARSAGLNRRICIGIAVGAVVGLLVSPPLQSSDPLDFDGVWLVIAGVGLGMFSATSSWFIAESARRATVDEPMQRENGVRLRDYLPTWSAASVVAVLIASVGVVAILVWVPTTGIVAPGDDRLYLVTGAALLAVMVGMVVTLAVAKASFARPQRAVSPEALAWDDAIASQALVPIAYLGALYGGLLIVQFGSALSSAVTSDAFLIGFVVLLSAPFPIFVLALVSIVAKPSRHFLRRLWPAVPQTP